MANANSEKTSSTALHANGGPMTSTTAATVTSSSTTNPDADWSLHPSGKYYISKSSPWCYSEASGYFYFDSSGRIIKQDEESKREGETDTGKAANDARVEPVEQPQSGPNSRDEKFRSSKGKLSILKLEEGEIGEDAETDKVAKAMVRSGYIPMEDRRHYYHPDTGYVYDTLTSSYSFWDEATKSYVPVQDNGQAAPQSNAMMKLVVIQSKLLEPGSIILVDATGLTVGRDKAFERRLVLNEISVSRFHCTIYVNRIVEPLEPIPNRQAVEEQEPDTDATVEKANEREQIDFSSALERAKAIAARLTADLKSRDTTPIRSTSPTHGTKRVFSDVEDYRSSSPADSFRSNTKRSRAGPRPPEKRFMDCFFVTDGGSTHGTFINGERLSQPKMSSQPHRLQHGDTLVIGSTTMKVHIHASWGCDECRVTSTNVISTEPKSTPPKSADNNTPQTTKGEKTKKGSLEVSRREELRRLKREALGEDAVTKPRGKRTQYVDRAAMRRKMHGVDASVMEFRQETQEESSTHSFTPSVPTPTHATPITAADPTNIGSRMLQKMGWTEGQGLGASGGGRVDPVAVSMRMGRQGLGMGTPEEDNIGGMSGRKETLYEATMRRARERFNEINND
ncbi:uncharacterized protein SPPG_05006 [Spizellomyces punctatus DAOM BR117]|uniref:G-patch domain-containing protein n=1 Tax=Spizellomyces punctatus (strain DAOM BR117) TaxID=645134 RepID=A0A0L0HDV1_SPIPD|nr:uncharacterized protein SPPG_05006 [Spizellomyces punctatus DAOM BR117]KNC99620.1 hypothetical protein SPPG_05006 [Spizellomyces punctatus DAOM BR117]|eukprot:XP_016607660.1 hypothetical protein SPPG_05006 [Spizellomyces punctatus DAOM BR117]